MGTAPLRRCAFPGGCSARVPSGRCPRHQQLHQQQRGTAHQRGYTSRWRTFAQAYLRDHPRCGDRDPEAPETADSRCRLDGVLTLSREVDHIEPHRGEARLFWGCWNLQALCHACHNAKTKREQRTS
jgi:5-methylcytosine-specific restriction protein A